MRCTINSALVGSPIIQTTCTVRAILHIPFLKESPPGRELQELFTPNLSELGFARENTRQPVPRLGLLLLLKSFQKLGYFVRLAEIPPPIALHIAKAVGWNQVPDGLSAYDAGTARFRHMALVRSYMGVTPFADPARKLMLRICLASSRVREDLADIVNTAIEELVRQRYEDVNWAQRKRLAQ